MHMHVYIYIYIYIYRGAAWVPEPQSHLSSGLRAPPFLYTTVRARNRQETQRMCFKLFKVIYCRLQIVAPMQSELEIRRKRKEKLATSHENPKQRRRINRIPRVREAFCTGPPVLATSSLLLSRSEDMVFMRCVYCRLLCCNLFFLIISSSGYRGGTLTRHGCMHIYIYIYMLVWYHSIV